METLEIREQEHPFEGGEAKVISISGYLDAASNPKFEEALDRVLAERPKHLVISLKGLEYVSSAGIGLLLSTQRTVSKYGGNLRVVNVPERILRIVQVLGFSRIIPLNESLEAAVASFQSESS